MKNFLNVIVVLITCLCLTSCETYGQMYIEPTYVYVYNGLPVVYVNRIPHIRHYDGRVWRERPMPMIERRHIQRIEHYTPARRSFSDPQKPYHHNSGTITHRRQEIPREGGFRGNTKGFKR